MIYKYWYLLVPFVLYNVFYIVVVNEMQNIHRKVYLRLTSIRLQHIFSVAIGNVLPTEISHGHYKCVCIRVLVRIRAVCVCIMYILYYNIHVFMCVYTIYMCVCVYVCLRLYYYDDYELGLREEKGSA